MTVRIGIIGGTGVYDPDILSNISEEVVTTKYGDISLKLGEYADQRVAFLPRHGSAHAVPPHRVNYRGNIMALKKLGVERILATAAVGSLNNNMEPGQMVIVDQFIDFTKNRPATFFEDDPRGVVHIDMTEPYCPDLRQLLIKTAEDNGFQVHPRGNYVCTEGPRFETPAEINMFRILGGDLVGMTSVPEVVLAREAEICYASIALVTNFAAGISSTPLTHEEVMEAMNKNANNLKLLTMKTIEKLIDSRNCCCSEALKELGTLG